MGTHIAQDFAAYDVNVNLIDTALDEQSGDHARRAGR